MLHCEADEDDDSFFRFLVNGKLVKYVTIDQGLYSLRELTLAPLLVPRLPPFPDSDWNEGHISKSPETGKPYFAQAKKADLPSISSIWHPVHVDILQLVMKPNPRSNVCRVLSPDMSLPAIAKFARFPWEMAYFEAETTAYQWIEGKQIGPRFLGHLEENGRTIGFLIEAFADSRHPGPIDLEICQQALSKLHCIGVKHGDINKHNFLVLDDRAVLLDFESATKCDDAKLLEEELQELERHLKSTTGIGGVRSLEQ